jgi:ankyrin repeat protein
MAETSIIECKKSKIKPCMKFANDFSPTTTSESCSLTMLALAAFENDTEKIKDILDEDKSCLNMGNEYGMTPLMIAAIKGNFESVELLLFFGAKPNICTTRPACGMWWGNVPKCATPLYAANSLAKKNKVELSNIIKHYDGREHESLSSLAEALKYTI